MNGLPYYPRPVGARARLCGLSRMYRMTRMNSRQRGFTLLEILVVVVIIGLLAGIVAPRLFKSVTKSEVTTAKAQIESLGKALDQYRLDIGHYPSTQQGLAALTHKPAEESRWDGPYLKKDAPLDPWGNPYVYRYPSEHGADFDLSSWGADRAPGGTGDGADIVNW